MWDALRDLVTFTQFKKRGKHPLRNFNFSKVAGLKPATLLKLTLLHGCFSRFFKLYKWYQIAQRTTYVSINPICLRPERNRKDHEKQEW